MKEKKEQFTYWLEPSLVEEMENMLYGANATSKGDFVRQSLKFYMAYLRQQKSLDFISPLLAQTIKTQVESVEKNISEMLFKVAVEQSIQNNLTAWRSELSEDVMKSLRENCANEVARLNGTITFEDAYNWQHGGE